MTKSIMIQGTGSNVGKSLLVAGLCRAFTQRGLAVRPFKPQNMSNNAAVTVDGGEIGRAQALQALACGVLPHSDMNPVLLKPESETGSQVILQGKRLATVKAKDYAALKPKLLNSVLDSYARITEGADLVVIEGAGSPAEINLRAGDIANMGFAEHIDAPVILVGDIDRGGVIAQLAGTHAVLSPEDLHRIKGFIINKFRGDPALFANGLTEIVQRTGWHSLGLIPYTEVAAKLPAEDILDIRSSDGGPFKIAVPKLSRIANFDDLDPLMLDPAAQVTVVEPGHPLPGDAQLIVLPGTKSTIADLAFFRAQGWDVDLRAHIRRGGHVLGICGGFQLLGKHISDPDGVEGTPQTVDGLGLLDVSTVMGQTKRLANVEATYGADGTRLCGYEIHMGKTSGPDCDNAWLQIGDRPEGAATADGQVRGCYLHGLFATDAFRQAFLRGIGAEATSFDYAKGVQLALDALADHLTAHVDLDLILDISARFE